MKAEEVKQGVCFMYKAPFSPVPHFYIVLAVNCLGWDSDDCVIINITEAKGGAEAFTINPGEHSYIYKKSEVNFGDCEIVTRQAIADCVDAGPQFENFNLARLREIGLRCKTHEAVIGRIKKAVAAKYFG